MDIRYELWVDRATPGDLLVSDEMRCFLKNLVDFVEAKETDVALPLDFLPHTGNKRAQQLLSYLDACSVMIKVFREILPSLAVFKEQRDAAVDRGNVAEAARCSALLDDTRGILTLCNRLVCGYIKGEPKNQNQVFKYLEMFSATIDAGVDSMQVVAEVFRGNDELASRVDETFVATMAAKIADSGQNPDFLHVMTAIAEVGTVPRPETQSLILRELTAAGREQHVMFLCTDPASRNYALRRALCRDQASSKVDPRERDESKLHHLPPLLAYHVTLVNLLAACAAGTKNINIVEAKLQSIYPLDALLAGLLDEGHIIEVKLSLLRYMRETYVDAEMKFHGLGQHKALWRFFATIPGTLAASIDDVVTFARAYNEALDTSEGHDAAKAAREAVVDSWGYDQRLRVEFCFEICNVLRLFWDEYYVETQVPSFVKGLVFTKFRPATASYNPRFHERSASILEQFAPGLAGLQALQMDDDDDDESLAGASSVGGDGASESEGSTSSMSEEEAQLDEVEDIPGGDPGGGSDGAGGGKGGAGGAHEDPGAVEWASGLISEVVLGLKTMVEVGGCYLTDGFLVEAVDAADIMLRRSPHLPPELDARLATSGWALPRGVTRDDLTKFRKAKVAHRGLWKVGASPFAPPKLPRLDDKAAFLSGLGKLGSRGATPSLDMTSGRTQPLGSRRQSMARQQGSMVSLARANSAAYATGDEGVVDMLGAFIKELEMDEGLIAHISRDFSHVTYEISALPEIKESPDKGDLRREYLVQRLVYHVYASIDEQKGMKHLEPACTRSTKWMLKFFRNMVEVKWGMGIDARDEDGGAEQDRAAASTQMLLNNWGATALCLDLVAAGINDDVKVEALRLLIALLFKEGGHTSVQQTIREHLERNDSSPFFVELKRIFVNLIEWHQSNPDGESEVDLPDGLPKEIIAIKCLQLMCEGHFKANQEILRTQDGGAHEQWDESGGSGSGDHDGAGGGVGGGAGAKKGGEEESHSGGGGASTLSSKGSKGGMVPNEFPENLLDQMVDYLNVVSKIPFRVASRAANRVAELVLEVLQGPCEANQLHFCRKTDLLEILNRMMRSRTRNDQNELEEKTLKFTVVKIFQALLEGRSSADELYKKIVGIVHLDVLISHVELPVLKLLSEELGEGMDDLLPTTEIPGGKDKGGKDGKDTKKGKGGGSPKAPPLDPKAAMRARLVEAQAQGAASTGFSIDLRPVTPGAAKRYDANLAAQDEDGFGDGEGGGVERGDDDGVDEDEAAAELAEVKEMLQTAILVLLRMFSDFDPSLAEDKMMLRLEDLMESEVKSVEIVWNGKLQRRFFHVPQPLCSLIGETTKQNLVTSVDRTNEDNKLIDFMKRINDIYLELKWQEYLADLGIQRIFSRENQNRATWLSFCFAITLNAIFMFGYEYKPLSECEGLGLDTMRSIYLADSRSWNNLEGPEAAAYHELPCLTPSLAHLVTWLNWAQIIVAIGTFFLYVVVMSKPKYDKAMSENELNVIDIPLIGKVQPDFGWGLASRRFSSAFVSLTEGFPPALYYLGYTVVCVLIQEYYPPLCAFLLLDIVVKSPTTSNVLMAVYKPRKQLLMTVMLLVFCIYIFSTMYFFSFRLQFKDDDSLTDDCQNLFDCFLTNLNYGMRLSGGSGDNMVHDANNGRVAVDFLYFWVVIVVLLNVVFGVIIDTFAELREGLVQRDFMTKKFCFICGISSETFDRAGQNAGGQDGGRKKAGKPNEKGAMGWKDHYHKDHNMWCYAYFMISLKEQDKDDDDGLELYVRKCMETEDVEWFPKSKAMCLKLDGKKSEAERVEAMMAKVELQIVDSERNLSAYQEKRNEKLMRTVEHLQRQQKETSSKLDSMTELIAAQAKLLRRLAYAPTGGSLGGGDGVVDGADGRPGSSAGGGGPESAALTRAASAHMLMDASEGQKPAWEERIVVEVLDAMELPPVGGGLSMGAITARVIWNADTRGETETMWMSPKPTWFVNNKFSCRRVTPQDTLTVELVRRDPKAKAKKSAAVAADGGGGEGGGDAGGTGDVLGTVQLAWPELKNAVFNGDKAYFSVTASAEYRAAAPNAKLGLKIS